MSGQHGPRLLRLVGRYYSARDFPGHTLRQCSSAAASFAAGVAVLQSRGVLLAEGQQVLGFLQGLVSNDMRPLEDAGPQQAPVYATILTPKGKFLHDVFVFPHPEAPGSFLLDVDRRGVSAALQLLNRYKLRRPIAFRDVTSDFAVAASWGSTSPPPGPWWRPDPRLRDLGFRGLLPVSEAAKWSGAAAAGASEEDYRALRYTLGVAEGEAEIPSGQAAPLEYNVDALNGVSYNKGCYVGQERNSFTHYRGVVRKRLMPVRLEPLGPAVPAVGVPAAAASSVAAGHTEAETAVCVAEAGQFYLAPPPAHPAPGTDILGASTGRSRGTLRASALLSSTTTAATGGPWGGTLWGIAYLKLEAALPAAEGRGELLVAPAVGPEPGPVVAEAGVQDGGNVGRGTVGPAGSAGEGGAGQAVAVAGGWAVAGVGGAAWRVVPVRPAWWPPEWGREEEAAGRGGAG